jgi:hypothetical protein
MVKLDRSSSENHYELSFWWSEASPTRSEMGEESPKLSLAEVSRIFQLRFSPPQFDN